MDKIFQPQKFKEFDKDNRGTKINLTNQRTDVDFKRDNAQYALAADEFELMTYEQKQIMIANVIVARIILD